MSRYDQPSLNFNNDSVIKFSDVNKLFLYIFLIQIKCEKYFLNVESQITNLSFHLIKIA